MFSRNIPLFSLLGFKVRMDPSWLFLALLLLWTLSGGLFPFYYPNLSPATYFGMSIAAIIGLFGSIVLHEFGHAWVAQRFGLPMQGITLFLFGGVAEMSDDSPSPLAEFWMAIAGPAVSVLILLITLLLSYVGQLQHWPVPVVGVLQYLALMNGVLIVFNMLPAFPLDGGRVLRALLWQWKKSIQWATRIASNCGKWFGMALIVLGILSALQGNILSGIWWVLIGLFLRQTADMSYQQVQFKRYLQNEPIGRFVTTDVVAVPADLSIQDLVEAYFYRYYFKGYPVLEGDEPVGYVSIRQLQRFSPDEWGRHTVREVMTPLSPQNSIPLQADAMEALNRMNKSGVSPLLVLDGAQLVGLISLKDLLQFYAIKNELEVPSGNKTGA